MKQLTIEHLSAYLPYNVKCYANAKHFGVNVLVKELDVYMMMNILNNDTSYKIALRPLSDLTKKDLKEKLKAINYRTDANGIEAIISDIKNNMAEYELMLLCFENHIDCFGLIEQGLAIDLNKI